MTQLRCVCPATEPECSLRICIHLQVPKGGYCFFSSCRICCSSSSILTFTFSPTSSRITSYKAQSAGLPAVVSLKATRFLNISVMKSSTGWLKTKRFNTGVLMPSDCIKYPLRCLYLCISGLSRCNNYWIMSLLIAIA